jgi:hypothetical protein
MPRCLEVTGPLETGDPYNKSLEHRRSPGVCRTPTTPALLLSAFVVACAPPGGPDPLLDTETDANLDSDDENAQTVDFPLKSCADFPDATSSQEIAAGDTEALLIAVNSLDDGDVVVLGEGVFALDSQVTIRAGDVTLCGQGPGTEGSSSEGTILDFAEQVAQSNGVDVVGDGIVISDLAVLDTKKDGIRVEDSDGVTIQRVRVSWREIGSPENGAYAHLPGPGLTRAPGWSGPDCLTMSTRSVVR